MSAFRHPFPEAYNAHTASYGALPSRLEPPAPEPKSKPKPEPVALKKQQPKDTGRVKKRKAAPAAANKTKLLTCLLPSHSTELQAIWKAYPRMPSVESRRAWAHARSLEPAVVHKWFYRQKGEDHSLPDYELAVGTPPDIDDVKVKLEEPVVKPEPSDSLLPWERSLSAAPTLVNPVQSRKPSGRSQRSAIFVADADSVPMDPFAFLPDESPEATSKWLQGLQGLSGFGSFVPDDKPYPPTPVAAAPGSNTPLLSSAPSTNQPAVSSLFQKPQTLHAPVHAAAPRQPTAPAPAAPAFFADPLPPPLAHPPAHPLQTAFHTANDFVPPWLLPPPDCVMIPRALYAALARTARMYAPEIFQQFPLYDFVNLA